MKKWIVSAVLTLLLGIYTCGDVKARYEYSRTVGSFWDLSVKASTLEMKADYLDKFVAAVDSSHLQGHDAIFFPTPDNSIEQNITTLKSLQQRMREIRAMNVRSFEYQQAISQITAQEQDEARAMLGVISGRWFLSHHPLFWGWIEGLFLLTLIGGALIAWCVTIAIAMDD